MSIFQPSFQAYYDQHDNHDPKHQITCIMYTHENVEKYDTDKVFLKTALGTQAMEDKL